MDGFTRRSFLQLGMGTLAALALAPRARAGTRGVAKPRGPRARACILLYMEGGPSQIDTWDPKPGRPTGGEFRAIGTAVAGIQVSEHLPLLAARAKNLAIVRSVTSKEGNHQRARHLMHTGYPPQGGVDHPALGSLVGATRGTEGRALPTYVSVGGPGEDAGFLSPALSPFIVQKPTQGVKYIEHAQGVDDARFGDRMKLWRGLEDGFAANHAGEGLPVGQRALGEQAVAMMSAPATAAFRIGDEPAKVRESYGDSELGVGCLMARRLVEAGVPFVEVTQKGWDTHKDNFTTVKELSGHLDRALSALLDDLAARGLLDSTLILWMGDFGRTPRINGNAGRDHYPKCTSVVLAGGGVRGGQVVGATDPDGTEIAERPIIVPDLFRTAATLLGVDPDVVRMAPSGRPIKTVDGGQVIKELGA
jgi:Protein of unknown function (DUF1501)